MGGVLAKVGAVGLKEIAASHLFAAKAVNENMKNFVNVFALLGAAFVLVFALLVLVLAVQIWSERNPRIPLPPPTSPPRQQQTTPTVSAVAKATTVSPSSEGGKSAAGTERNVHDHETTAQKAGGL